MSDNSNDNVLKKAIIKTIVFFDLFDYPLTEAEIWKYLWLPDSSTSLNQTEIVVALSELTGLVEMRGGFYYRAGREEIIGQRQASGAWAEEKFRIAYAATGWLKYLVGVKMVAIVNSVVLGSVKRDSDIDLFIVVASGRMWLVRFAVTLLVQLLGVRRHGKHISNRLCLSFYVTEDQLNLSVVRNQSDPYFYYWLATLCPLYDDGCYKKFIMENLWARNYLPNFSSDDARCQQRVMDNKCSRFFKLLSGFCFYSFFGAGAERLARKLQRKKMAGNFASLAGEPDTRVIISDTMLKFHESDRREEFRKRWEDSYMLILAKL